MILVDEPGPIERIPLYRFPFGRGNKREFETIAARVTQQLQVTADVIEGPTATMRAASQANIAGDFSRTIPAAVAEIGAQLGTAADIDPARMYVAALESLADLDDAGAGLSGAMSGANVGPPSGGSTFGTVSWATAGDGGSPSSPGAPPSAQQPGAPPSDGGPAPPAGDGSPPASGDEAPPPAPAPPPADAPTFGDPTPGESDVPLI